MKIIKKKLKNIKKKLVPKLNFSDLAKKVTSSIDKTYKKLNKRNKKIKKYKKKII